MSSKSPARQRRDDRRGIRPAAAVKLIVSYDGTEFGGSQRQPGSRTVQGELEQAVARVFGVDAPVYLAGRTDQGVHAAGQVASFADYRPELQSSTVERALNAHLPGDLAVIAVTRMPLGFHARHDAVWREYRYRIWVGSRQPLAIRYTWQRESTLAMPEMAAAAAMLIGTHDVAAFAAGGEGVPWSEKRTKGRGTVRTIHHCAVVEIEPWWSETATGQLMEIRIVADAFLPKMVRAITGALVEIGRANRPATWIRDLIAAQDRRLAPMNAPAHGLTLWRVGYAGDPIADGYTRLAR